ncbi:YitT family protein [Bacillus sp. FJAT-27231]|uniref:YitT family protein n=1 Tax=Bacillus sp. FJAT-27231 TaxID=1679168 RepID=UPI000B27146A|nr:YitT family protein [Bacillus sp. FJAT-27231]
MSIALRIAALAFGAFVQGIAMTFFLFPHQISSGGAAGLSIILNFLFQTPYSATLWMLNAVMIVIAFKQLGKSNAAGTMFCVTVTAVTIHVFSPFITEPLSYPAFDLAIGASIFGIGLGILFRLGASSGGMDILALIISKWRGVKPGRTLFYINSTILLLAGFIVDVKTIFYALACQWISGKIIDLLHSISIEKYPILRILTFPSK